MNDDRDRAAGPFPATPTPTGSDDSWKTQRTDCWPTPTPERIAEHNRMMTPLDGGADPVPTDSDDPDSGSEEVADDEGMALAEDPADGEPGGPQVPRDDDIPERFAGSVGRLDDLADRPVAEHAEAFDSVHRDLRQSLDDIER